MLWQNIDAYNFLCDLHKYVEESLDGDLLWNYSMPPKFKRKYIKLPPHRESNATKLAHLYRLGLRNRYGDKMQSTAGIHYNFSFSDKFLEILSDQAGKDIQSFKKDEAVIIPSDINYENLSGLSNEVKSKLISIKPKTLGQAIRIDGITPAAIIILLSHIKKLKLKASA